MKLIRLAILTALAGPGLLSGCSGTQTQAYNTNGNRSFLSRLCGRLRLKEKPAVIEAGALPICDGPVFPDHGAFPAFPVGDGMPVPFTPGTVPFAPGTVPGIPPGVTPMAPTPRLIPQPQATQIPYTP